MGKSRKNNENAFSSIHDLNHSRYVDAEYRLIRLINVQNALFIIPFAIFSIIPYFLGLFPLSLWTPFDQYADVSIYMTMYAAGVVGAFTTICVCICANTYLHLMFICLHYNYKLVGERVENVGCQSYERNERKADIHAQMIYVIKLNLKTNR